MEIGVHTFAELRGSIDPVQRMRNLMEEVEVAEQAGLDVFGVGEHHRPDFAVSAPAVVLGAAAARTSRIRLTSAVTVLSSDDPVRVFQEFAEVDLLSDGRAEIMPGAAPSSSRSRSSAWISTTTTSCSPRSGTRRGALVVGSPEEVVEKIVFHHELFGHDRFLMQTSVGSLPHGDVLRSIELLGTQVAPAVRAAVG